MDISDDQRVTLGRLAQEQRRREYGTKLRAYQAASLNAATWDRFEKGLTVRDDRLRAAVAALWPESLGDWKHVLGLTPEDDAISELGLKYAAPPVSRSGLDGYLHRLQMRLEDLEDRVDALEAGDAASLTALDGTVVDKGDAALAASVGPDASDPNDDEAEAQQGEA